MCCANGEHGVRYSASDSQPPPEAASVSPRVMRGTNFVNLCSTRPIQLAFAVLLVCAAALAQQPRIDSLSPSQGPIAGGTLVSIRGANFAGASITLDRRTIAPISQTDSEVLLPMPPHANGYAIVGVTAGANNTTYARFLYLAPRLQDLPPGFITTVAGIGSYGGEYGPATSTSFPLSLGMAIDPAGQLYFADTNDNRILRIRGDGILEPFAGNSLSSGPRPVGQTPALDVSITFPRSIAFDSGGNLIVPDDGAYLWRVDPDGIAEIIAGTGQFATSASEGVPARGTAIGQPSFVAVDRDDNTYFLDWP